MTLGLSCFASCFHSDENCIFLILKYFIGFGENYCSRNQTTFVVPYLCHANFLTQYCFHENFRVVRL